MTKPLTLQARPAFPFNMTPEQFANYLPHESLPGLTANFVTRLCGLLNDGGHERLVFSGPVDDEHPNSISILTLRPKSKCGPVWVDLTQFFKETTCTEDALVDELFRQFDTLTKEYEVKEGITNEQT